MNECSRKDVLIDLCVQRAYLEPSSAHCIANRAQVFPNLKRLMAFARWVKQPLISCVDVDAANRIGDQFVALQGVSTPLRQRYGFSVLPDHHLVESDNSLSVSLDILETHQQVVVTKVHRDPYTNPKLDRLLTEMPARRFVVFGVTLEASIRMLVLGLLRRNRHVLLIDDACGFHHAQEAGLVLRKLLVKGCQATSTLAYIRDRASAMKPVRPLRLRVNRSVA